MPKINITLNEKDPLFALNERVLYFVQNAKDYQEVEDSVLLWQKSLDPSKIEKKDILQANRSISPFLKKCKTGDLVEADIAKFSDALLRCANFEDEKNRSNFDSKLTRISKQGTNITKVKVAKSQWDKLIKDQAQYKADPQSLEHLDEIGAQYALYPVSALAIQVSSTKGTISDDKPGVRVEAGEVQTAPLYNNKVSATLHALSH